MIRIKEEVSTALSNVVKERTKKVYLFGIRIYVKTFNLLKPAR